MSSLRLRVEMLVVWTLAALCLAPTAGDIGGCGAEATPLDTQAFAQARKDEDCQRCRACGLVVPRCGRACDPAKPPDTSIPTTCKPLRHDGDVCLHALSAASCTSYATYVDETAPATPSECDFCKERPSSLPLPAPGFGSPGAGVDASAEGGP
jgi:hypothetical protein